jgi:hypothetical protein
MSRERQQEKDNKRKTTRERQQEKDNKRLEKIEEIRVNQEEIREMSVSSSRS